MAIQIFGTKKCPVTRKAERFFKERDADYHFVDLSEKGISPGELKAIRQASKGAPLMDEGGKLYKARGLSFMDYDEDEEILATPLLLRTPVVRDGSRVVLGDAPEAWKLFL